MAIQGNVTVFGDLPVVDAYVRIEGVHITKQGDGWCMSYDLAVYKGRPTTESPKVRLPAPSLDRIKCDYSLGDGNPVELAYEHLKELDVIANGKDV